MLRIPFHLTGRRGRRAVAAVEFAFLAPLFILATIGTVEVGRAFWMYATLQFAADETSRHLMVDAAATDAEIADYVRDRLHAMDGAEVEVDVDREVVGGVTFVVVEASVDFGFITALFPRSNIQLVGRSRTALQ